MTTAPSPPPKKPPLYATRVPFPQLADALAAMGVAVRSASAAGRGEVVTLPRGGLGICCGEDFRILMTVGRIEQGSPFMVDLVSSFPDAIARAIRKWPQKNSEIKQVNTDGFEQGAAGGAPTAPLQEPARVLDMAGNADDPRDHSAGNADPAIGQPAIS